MEIETMNSVGRVDAVVELTIDPGPAAFRAPIFAFIVRNLLCNSGVVGGKRLKTELKLNPNDATPGRSNISNDVRRSSLFHHGYLAIVVSTPYQRAALRQKEFSIN